MAEENNALNQSPKAGDEKMGKAYEMANKLLRDRLKKENVENLEVLEKVVRTDIICVTGTYDHIHLVLKYMGLPFTSVSHEDLLKFKPEPTQTIFINCASNFPAEAARKLSTFVNQGGQLITTDWALKNVLEVAFPDMVKYNGRATADEVVRIEVIDKEDPVLTGFLDEESEPVWWLEGSSYPIKVLNKKEVKVLVRSKELGEKYGDDPVIISFTKGKGIVYHMISHFYLQRTETRDAKQSLKATDYAVAKGATKETIESWDNMEPEEEINYGTVQSASTSAEFISRVVLKQKKKFKK